MNTSDLKASLRLGDVIHYRCANPLDSKLPTQVAWQGPYTGIVVSVGTFTVQVRADGWWGTGTLYSVSYRDILSVER